MSFQTSVTWETTFTKICQYYYVCSANIPKKGTNTSRQNDYHCMSIKCKSILNMLTKVLDNDPLKGTHVQGFQWAPTTDQKASATLLGEVGYSFLRNWGWEWRLSKNDSDKTLIKAVIRLKKDTFYHHFNTLLISIKK